MDYVFEVTDKSGRKIHLTKERWGEHIKLEHQDIESPEEIELALKNPDKTVEIKENVFNYYKYFKHKNSKSKYLKVIVKYLNGKGFVVTAYYIGAIGK